MTDSFLVSKLGVLFGVEATHKMFWFRAELPKRENNVLMWGLVRDQDNRLQIILAADPVPSSGSIEDEVNGIPFYWVGKEEDFEMIRENYCIDYDKAKREFQIVPKEK